MERALDDAAAEFSALLLLASFGLIGASLAGLGGSLATAGLFAVVSIALFAVRERLAVIAAEYYLLARILEDAWIGSAAATATALVALGATPGELQTLGGLIGLAGVLNYFLRPLYRLVYRLASRVTNGPDGGL